MLKTVEPQRLLFISHLQNEQIEEADLYLPDSYDVTFADTYVQEQEEYDCCFFFLNDPGSRAELLEAAFTDKQKVVIVTPQEDIDRSFHSLLYPISGLITLEWFISNAEAVCSSLQHQDFYLEPGLHHQLADQLSRLQTKAKPIRRFQLDEQQIPAGMSARDQKLLTYLINGYSTSQIADEMYYSAKTVKSYVSHLIRMVQVPDRTALVLHALKNEWVYDER
ncbi:response regulator transcription factor [Alkalicoccus chagannorensis]|uniref:response regulator transcription factor n=1 Tax=Alkalicoccus chagannorensis TaxID=427072 RepID=UPI0004214049|nr:LuxR C-terminal-related transcriptional regulator [Alkalicoccus chagannorensis]